MIIGFTPKTSKKISKLFCRHFRHCVVLLPTNTIGGYTLVQIARDGIRLIPVGRKEIAALSHHGWVWVSVPDSAHTKSGRFRWPLSLLTCVGFAKRAIGIWDPWIWTPDQLYRYLVQKQKRL